VITIFIKIVSASEHQNFTLCTLIFEFYSYPCLCLCFGVLQITKSFPFRFMILHLLQIFLTDARTFIPLEILWLFVGKYCNYQNFYNPADTLIAQISNGIHPSCNLQSMYNSSFCEIIRTHFNHDPIARQKPDIIHPHPSRDMGQYFVAILKLHPESRAGQCFSNGSLQFDYFLFFGHIQKTNKKRQNPRLSSSFQKVFWGHPLQKLESPSLCEYFQLAYI